MELRYSKSIKELSPLKTILKFRCFRGKQNLLFHYSIYENGVPGYGKTKSRKTKDFNDLNNFYTHLEDIINNLPAGKELALHSKVIDENNVEYHIPFIDFRFEKVEEPFFFNKMSELQKNYNYELYLFDSGRSLHGYMDALIPKDKWLLFLADSGLLNREIELIDSRWLFHSIKQGFSSLRLSCNTSAYLKYPTLKNKIPKYRHNLVRFSLSKNPVIIFLGKKFKDFFSTVAKVISLNNRTIDYHHDGIK